MNLVKSNKKIFSIIITLSFIIIEFMMIKFLDLKLHDYIMVVLFFLVSMIALNTNLVIGLISSFLVILFYGFFVIIGGTTDYLLEIGISYYYLAIPALVSLVFGLIGTVDQKSEMVSESFEDDYKELVRIDELTGFRNSKDFNINLDEEISRIRRYGGEMTLMMINIDSFDEMNDIYGFNQGNKFLKYLSEFVVELTRNVDKHYRISPDRFAVILPQTDGEGADILKERFIEELEAVDIVVKSNNQRVDIEVDIVFLEYTDHNMDAKTFIKELENKIR